MRVAVVGSRGFARIDMIPTILNGLKQSIPDMHVVSGGAEGPDLVAEQWANANGVPCTIYPANWEVDGDKAGIKRNGTIVGDSELLLAFWDGSSAGCLDSIMRARKKNLKLQVFLA